MTHRNRKIFTNILSSLLITQKCIVLKLTLAAITKLRLPTGHGTITQSASKFSGLSSNHSDNINYNKQLNYYFTNRTHPFYPCYHPRMWESNVFILSVSVCVSVWATTFECLDIETSFLVWQDIMTMSR